MIKRLSSTSFRTFILYPLLVLIWESILTGGQLHLVPWFIPLLAWGYLQYRLVGSYRLARGGGGPGMNTPPEQLVTTGPYAYCRNPMYLGHIIFLLGLSLSLQSILAAVISIVVGVWFQFRVQRDELRLRERFGLQYVEYAGRVKRWIPYIF